MKRLLLLTTLFSGLLISNTGSSLSRTSLSPYQTVIAASAINYCGAEYGLISDKQAYEYIVAWVKEEHGLEPYQVYNLMQRKSWASDTDEFIEGMGGCKAIITEIQKELDSKPSGFSILKGKKDYEYIYGIINN